MLDELAELGLEIGQLSESFRQFANYPDVDEWPAHDVDLGNLEQVKTELRYVAHMASLIPTFPVDRGTDELMSTYERLVRIVRHRDLDRAADLTDVLEEFESDAKATQKCWPQGQKQGKAERDKWDGFATTIARPLIARWA